MKKITKSQLKEMIKKVVKEQLNEGYTTPDPTGLMEQLLASGWDARELLRTMIVMMSPQEALEILEDIRDDA